MGEAGLRRWPHWW